MTYDNGALPADRGPEISSSLSMANADMPILLELVKVLAPHPGGLRRWSVMRAIRNERERSGSDIPQKIEDEVERTFRHRCADPKAGEKPGNDAFFFRR